LEEENSDPYLLYGFGIWAYFSYIKWLIYIFLLLSLFHLPAIAIFGSSKGIEADSGLFYARMTMGSLVSSTPACFQAPLDNNYIHLQCPEKQLYLNTVISMGLIGQDFDDKDKCYFEDTDKCQGFLK
jgi:hypothetical protein